MRLVALTLLVMALAIPETHANGMGGGRGGTGVFFGRAIIFSHGVFSRANAGRFALRGVGARVNNNIIPTPLLTSPPVVARAPGARFIEVNRVLPVFDHDIQQQIQQHVNVTTVPAGQIAVVRGSSVEFVTIP
jgi:hypothetical protein